MISLFTSRAFIAGALSGLISAILVDLHAWSNSNGGAFNWQTAFKRWVTGAISGGLAQIGFVTSGPVGAAAMAVMPLGAFALISRR